jgi:holo-[acyl-carrier protein] synthase
MVKRMKQISLGTDICQISRIQAAVEKYGDKFLNKTFTEEEIRYARASRRTVYERLAVRFATKEAVSKALGVGINKLGWSKGINWKDVQIVRQELNDITISLEGKARAFAAEKNITSWKVSVSHMGDYATSTVIGIVE